MRHLIPRLVCIGLAAPAWGASLSVSTGDPPLEGFGLSADQRFARIDSLTSVHDDADGAERAATAYRLGQLYLATGLAKHRRLALEYLEEAGERGGDVAFPASRLRANTAHDMRYTRDARKWFVELTEEHPADPRSHVSLGRFYFAEAKRVLNSSQFTRSRMSYTAAVQADSTHADGWYGLVASLLALENYGPALAASRRLLRWEDTRSAAYLLMGAARVGRREFDEAQIAFEKGLQLASPRVRNVFLHGRGFLTAAHLADTVTYGIDPARLTRLMQEHEPGFGYGDKVDVKRVLENPELRGEALEIYWQTRDAWPSSLVNRRRLEFWKRLVEADILFGDPQAGGRGWDTEMGQALARWGRPDFMIYEPPSSAIDLEDWLHRGVRLPTSTDIPSQAQLWVWTYRRGSTWFSLLFTDPTYNSRWKAEGVTVQAMIARAKVQPMLFFDDEENAKFDLSVETAMFARGDVVRVETYLATRLFDRFGKPATLGEHEPLLVEWAIYNDAEERLDYHRKEMTEADLVAELTLGLGETWDGSRDELLTQLAATLEPGHYRLAIDVSSPRRGHRGIQLYLNIPTAPPPGFLDLSDLVLCNEFVPYTPELSVPPEFVKYAFAILPRPGGVFATSQAKAYVFFEAYNLNVDPGGLTHFNVSYAVYEAPDRAALAARGSDLDLANLAGVERMDYTFLEERTGLSPEGHVVKGSEVDLGGLPPGRYVLVVEVEDLLGEARTQRFVTFQKRPDS